jgi:hypothetical protein
MRSANLLPTSKRLSKTDLDGLIESLIALPVAEVHYPTTRQVCMNPKRACDACYFHESKWCLPHERQAKAQADLRAFIELEHSTSIEEAYAATMEACA